MSPAARLASTVFVLAAFAGLIAACGSKEIEVPANDPTRAGAELFAQRCQGCHTLGVVGAQGSSGGQKISGPNFNYRQETVDSVLYAVRNGGFGRGLMPSNVVVGEQARQVAEFVAKWAGRKAQPEVGPSGVRGESSQAGAKTAP